MALFELATGGVVMVRLYICLCNKCQVNVVSGDDQALATDAL